MSKVFVWPSAREGAQTDWIEFKLAAEDADDLDTKYRVNLSFFLSNWKCQFGACPGILDSGAMTDASCCQIGVTFGQHEEPEGRREEHQRIGKWVAQLTEEDCDNIDLIRKEGERGWTNFRTMKVVSEVDGVKVTTHEEVPMKTRITDGACVFANRHGGKAGKPGCALHVLANRLGIHHSETKPDICWMIPFMMGGEYDETEMCHVVTLSGTPGTMWGGYDTELGSVGHWCTEIPDAYNGVEPVYKLAEIELRKMMGDRAYEAMAKAIEGAGKRRYPMPGEAINGGRPMLPLLVENRVRQWRADDSKSKRSSQAALRRSESYLKENGIEG